MKNTSALNSEAAAPRVASLHVTRVSIGVIAVAGLMALAGMSFELLDRAGYLFFEDVAGMWLPAAGLVLCGIAILVSGADRVRRESSESGVWFRILVPVAGLLFWAQALATMAGETHLRPFGVPVDAIPFLVFAPVLVVSLFGLAWPSGLESREWQGVAADSAVGALGAVITWTILVFPGLDLGGSQTFGLPFGSAAVQLMAVVAVLVVAAASRRRSRLPIVQVVWLQLSILIYATTNALSDLAVGEGRQGALALWTPAYVASAMMLVAFLDRPANEKERASHLWLRDVWSSIIPLSPVAVAAGVLLLLLSEGLPASRAAAGAVAGILLILMLTVMWLRHMAAEDVRQASVAVASSTLQQATDQAWFQALIQDSRELVLVTDRDARIVYVSPSVSRLVGVDPDSLAGRSVDSIAGDLTLAAMLEASGRAEAEGSGDIEVTVVGASGAEHGVRFAVSGLTGLGSDGYVLTGHDVTDTRRVRALLGESRRRDRLTGLLNREAFLAAVGDALELTSPSSLAVVEIDLAGFRALNDTRGHAVGDEVLRGVADVLERSGGPIVAMSRISGDDFALLLRDPEIHIAVEATVSAIRHGLRSIPLSDGSSISIRISAGYATAAERTQAAALLEQADLAVARSASDPELTVVLYRHEMRNALLEQMRNVELLERSLDRREFVPHYMPVVRLRDGCAVSVEALARRRRPDGSWEASEMFIPLAERTGLVALLDHEVRRCAFADIAALQDVRPGLTLSVNVSPMEFSDALPDDVAQQITQAGIDPDLVIIELTESTVAKSADLSQRIISQLRGLGCRVALDDFGTGYSSLSGLGTMRLDLIKIDRSFVTDLATSSRALAMMRSITELGHSLGLMTVAEGVATAEQVDLLRGMGCDFAQGHLFAKALPFGELLDWLTSGAEPRSAARLPFDDPWI